MNKKASNPLPPIGGNMFTVELGLSYQDKITGFKGVATGECRYISGCNQILLAGKISKDGSVNKSV